MSDFPWVGVAFFGLIALIVFLMRADERRENALVDAKLKREELIQVSHTELPDWHEAYLQSKSIVPEAEWRAWMEERGYQPSAVLERAQLSRHADRTYNGYQRAVSNRKR